MTTPFAAITGAIITVLQQAPAISPNIFRARDRAIAEEYATAINVECNAGQVDYGQIMGAPEDWESKFTVECYARSSTLPGDLAVDPVFDQVKMRLAANSTLGGTVAWLRLVHFEATNDAAGQKTGWIGMTYLVTHRI